MSSPPPRPPLARGMSRPAAVAEAWRYRRRRSPEQRWPDGGHRHGGGRWPRRLGRAGMLVVATVAGTEVTAARLLRFSHPAAARPARARATGRQSPRPRAPAAPSQIFLVAGRNIAALPRAAVPASVGVTGPASAAPGGRHCRCRAIRHRRAGGLVDDASCGVARGRLLRSPWRAFARWRPLASCVRVQGGRPGAEPPPHGVALRRRAPVVRPRPGEAPACAPAARGS